MPKYTKKFKIKLIMEYLSGETGGRERVAKKYDIPDGTLKNWVEKYFHLTLKLYIILL